MKQKELPISIRAYAKQLQVDEKAVRRAIAEGKIKKGVDRATKKIIASKADIEWGNLHKEAKPQRGVSAAKAAEKMDKKKQQQKPGKPLKNAVKPEESSDLPDILEKNFSYSELIDAIIIHPDLPYSETLRREGILKMAGERMKLEEQQGILVKKAEVEKALFAIGDMLKKALFNIPNRCIDEIIAAPNKIEATNILNMEISSVLNQFAQHLQPQTNQ